MQGLPSGIASAQDSLAGKKEREARHIDNDAKH
jgi:hypothetical protein